MEKLSRPATQTPPPTDLEPFSDSLLSSLPLTEAASVTKELVAGVETLVRPGVTIDVLTENVTGVERLARFASHLFGEHNVAQDPVDRIQFAVVRTGGEELVRRGVGALQSGPPTRVSIASAAIAAANESVDVNSDLRVATQLLAELQPTAPAEGAVGLAIDVAGVISNGSDSRIPELEAINARALSGGYGAPTQVVSMASNLATGFHETRDLLTGANAEDGGYGVFVRVGNEIGNNVFGATHSRYESEWEFRAD